MIVFTECPACGCMFLELSDDGHLRCKLPSCPEPDTGKAIEKLKARIKELEDR